MKTRPQSPGNEAAKETAPGARRKKRRRTPKKRPVRAPSGQESEDSDGTEATELIEERWDGRAQESGIQEAPITRGLDVSREPAQVSGIQHERAAKRHQRSKSSNRQDERGSATAKEATATSPPKPHQTEEALATAAAQRSQTNATPTQGAPSSIGGRVSTQKPRPRSI